MRDTSFARGWLLLGSLCLACGSSDTDEPSERVRCQPGEGASARPRTVSEAIELVNSLPMPVSAECFAESLERPLEVEVSRSVFSAQPAKGERSPRVFIFNDPLIMTVVIDGEGRDLLEFGELVSERRALRAEIEFPITQPVTAEQPYERILFDDGGPTTCSFCHDFEEPSQDVAGGFISVPLRPDEASLVPLTTLLDEQRGCDASAEPDRCRYLAAIVGHGELRHRAFASDLPTIFD